MGGVYGLWSKSYIAWCRGGFKIRLSKKFLLQQFINVMLLIGKQSVLL